MSLFEDVGDFHRKFGLPRTGEVPLRYVPESEFRYRLNFIQEEINELFEAYYNQDMAKIADALADVVWVTLGTAHHFGIPFDAVWAEVVRANMSKVRATGADDPRSTRKNALDVVKPVGWVPPNIEGALRDGLVGSQIHAASRAGGGLVEGPVD